MIDDVVGIDEDGRHGNSRRCPIVRPTTSIIDCFGRPRG